MRVVLGVRFNRSSSHFVAAVHVAKDLFRAGVLPRKESREQPLDVRATEKRALLLLAQLLAKHEEHRHHYQCHVMMPRVPEPQLVVGHSALALAIFKAPLHPIALPLHPAQAPCGCRWLLVGQGILPILSIQALGDQQFVAAPFATVLVPYIYALT